ncbi:MAG: hypothetical protein JNM70_18200 [Anaerolineae bacterium]|nr:hypothetical protein [Anaerolineae bacterium]
MTHRPTLDELLEAVRLHLAEQAVPALESDRRLYFQTLVAVHALEIIQRERSMGVDPLHNEWQRLNYVQGMDQPPADDPVAVQRALDERNRALCIAIRSGQYDAPARKAALYEHLLETARERLQVDNLQFLEALAVEGGVEDE